MYNFFSRSKKHQYEIESRRLSSQILIFFMFLVEEDNASEKVVIVGEELDDIARDGIGNLEDLLRLVLINEESRNLKVVVDGGELAKNINEKKNPDVLQACRCPLCDKCYRREYFFNQYLEHCESVS